ncbi:NAD(P)/FAD-dependent oxidoreductase [Rhodobacter calidifons]|uniref:NAD(P)/FAD-dependent oxidoreductase n=1 Tax=Rhodobacter calidifons TaxID=2715277 RepID=A0ABX0GA36_9RHOB|nr:NAD(P)/FAD-dependent oxidoreductase [Rhodobacter calidifons]NHB77730.1 NAD(P)/FAD-dependent oxidoreductase [Rhodobacter calidifons]
MTGSDPASGPAGYDVAVIGAGVVGCALARAFTLAGARVVVLEKAVDVLDGASKGNSAILHTGFDAPEGSLELACIREGYRLYHEVRERLGLPLVQAGAMVLAWTEEEVAALPALMDQAVANGVTDIQPLTGAEARGQEPQLSDRVLAGFRVPGEHLIDPWSAAHGYLLQALANGAVLMRQAEVLTGRHAEGLWQLATTAGPVSAGLVINAAGLWGDEVDRRVTGESWFTIKPRKGQFVVYDKTAAALAGHILLPVPTKITKGIVVCRTAFGNLLVGPTAEEQEDREHASLDRETLQALMRRGTEILPALARHEVTAVYAGLRPATEEKHYRIRTDLAPGYICVGGIRSTGLSAALGIAAHVVRLAAREFSPLADPVWPRMPNISVEGPRDWQCPGHGGVVCHCELVTRREIEAALSGPMPATSLAGLKRRTRVTMGRCQGFYCTAELARLTEGRLAQPMLDPGHV